MSQISTPTLPLAFKQSARHGGREAGVSEQQGAVDPDQTSETHGSVRGFSAVVFDIEAKAWKLMEFVRVIKKKEVVRSRQRVKR
jgi:hypothetical protein